MCAKPCQTNEDCTKGASGGFIQCPACWPVGSLYGGETSQCGPPAN